MEQTADIRFYTKNTHRPKFVIGFSVETKKLLHNSKSKLKEKNADWIIANDVSKKDIGLIKIKIVTIIESLVRFLKLKE